MSLATRLHFDFYSEAKRDNGEVSGLKTIDILRLDKRQANEYELFSQLVSEYQVPEDLRYSSSLQAVLLSAHPAPDVLSCQMSVGIDACALSKPPVGLYYWV